jgi:hypothetical protein
MSMISALSMARQVRRPAVRSATRSVYGDLVTGADEYERELLDAFDAGRSQPVRRHIDGQEALDAG